MGYLPYPEGKSTEADVISLVFALSVQGWRLHMRRWDGSRVPRWLQELLGWVLCCSCPAPPVPDELSPYSSVNTPVECEKRFCLGLMKFLLKPCCGFSLLLFKIQYLLVVISNVPGELRSSSLVLLVAFLWILIGFWLTAFSILLYRWHSFCCVGVSCASQRKTKWYFKQENRKSWNKAQGGRSIFSVLSLILNLPSFN